MNTYLQKIRKKLGSDHLIHPGARIIVENEHGDILFVERRDNGQLGLPAGGLEEGETIEMCIKREVWEETGLVLREAKVIGISSDPTNETVLYPNGDLIQYFVIEFYTNNWTGELKVGDTAEIKQAIFKDRSFLTELPENERGIIKSWEFYKKSKKILVR